MKEEILSHLNDPRQLEILYRENKSAFRREFGLLYPQLKGNTLADYWNERLSYQATEINWGSRKELIFVIIAALIAGVIAKLPHITGINEEFFYTRNIGFIVFPMLMAYFVWKNKLSAGKLGILAACTLSGLLFINFFPNVSKSDTLTLSCIHLVLFLYSLLGFAFVGTIKNEQENRLAYLKYNGDLVVMTTLIVIAGALMSAITIGLFSLIGVYIEQFYFKNVIVFALPAAPILGTYLTQTNPQLVGKVSPVIAKIFSPLVLVMLVIYLVAMAYSGKDPYNDREFLLVFNGLLIGVLAIIFFSVGGTQNDNRSKAETWILFLLSAVTIIVNAIALSAIIFRISEWGFTPNRTAVLGSNLLILINLIMVAGKLFKSVRHSTSPREAGNAIAFFLPIYFIWTVVVTFLFPLIFGFK